MKPIVSGQHQIAGGVRVHELTPIVLTRMGNRTTGMIARANKALGSSKLAPYPTLPTSSESAMQNRTIVACLFLCALFLAEGVAHAQQVNAAFGLNAITAPSASSASGNHFPQSVRGGLFPSFSGDFIFFKNQIGVNAEVSWRAKRSLSQAFQPFRPIFYDFNAIWAPRLAKSVQAELLAGIGAQSTRFYQDFLVCNSFSCTNFISSNHFMGHFGGGIRYYIMGHLFVRPEAHIYLVRHNVEFSSAHAARFGVSIGYTLLSP